MSVHDLCCIGYITQDKIVTTKNTIYMPGGTSFYFAHAIKHLDPNGFLLVTSLAHTEMNVVEDIRKEGIEVKALPSARSVCFENIYGENQNERTQRVTAKADPFTMEGLQDVNARIIHLGSLLADDFSLDVIKYLSGKGLLSVDVQGFLRKVDNEKVLPVDWPEKREALPYLKGQRNRNGSPYRLQRASRSRPAHCRLGCERSAADVGRQRFADICQRTVP